jgi:hypothetical protein
MREYYGLFEHYQDLRRQLMASLTDEDLVFSPGGDNRPLGALCREIGEIEVAYINSFQTFTQNFDYRVEEPELETSVTRLVEWYASLDLELREVVSELSEEDVTERVIDRGHNFKVPPRVQLAIYQEALLIFYGKVDVYLKAMAKPRTEHWSHWIA